MRCSKARAIFGGLGSLGLVSADVFLKGADLAFLTGAGLALVGAIPSLVRGSKKKLL